MRLAGSESLRSISSSSAALQREMSSKEVKLLLRLSACCDC
jgi:hypothetical protein